MRRRRNPPSAYERNVMEHARDQAVAKRLPSVENLITLYLDDPDDSEWLQEHYSAGEYLAKNADEAWEMSDVLFDTEEDAANAYEILKVAALELGGQPRYGRKSNPQTQLERRSRAAVRRHADDRRWRQRIPGGTKRAPATFERQSLIRGTAVELEHTNDPLTALEIAMDHLDEDPNYYGKLATIHREHNPSDPNACALGRWAWDRSTASCGPGAPSATQQGASEAARGLARKRWTLPPRERRMAARLLR